VNGSAGARNLAISAAAVIALSRFAPDLFVWPIAAALLAGVGFGALQLVAEADPAAEASGVPIESVILPGVAALAGLGAIRIVPLGIILVPAVALAALLVALAANTELRLARASGPPSSADRTAVLIELLLAAFLGFIGVAGLVPGGMPIGPIGAPAPASPDALTLGALAAADGIIGFLIAYRAAALRTSNLRDVLWFAVTGALVVAIAAVAVRAIEIPSVLGPALLVLVFFLWDAIHGAPYRRRDPRRIWEAALLAVLAIAVIGWTLGLRG
jgi:hypothetical protein